MSRAKIGLILVIDCLHKYCSVFPLKESPDHIIMGSLLNAFLIAIASTNFVATTTTHALAWSNSSWRCQRRRNNIARRKWISESISLMVSFPATTASLVIQHPTSSHAEEYDNPNYPAPPEERCETSFISSFFQCCLQGSLAAYKQMTKLRFLFPFIVPLQN